MVEFVHGLALELDPGWRRLPAQERRRSARAFAERCGLPSPLEGEGQRGGERGAGDGAPDGVTTLTYSSLGLQPGVDLLLWSLGPSVEALEERAASVLGAGLGAWARVRQSLIGHLGQSPYVRRPPTPTLFTGARARYLIVYPFSKSAEWYRLAQEARQTIMQEHIRVGRRFPQVRQLLASSFGIDEQDYLVAYETDDLEAFSELVRSLRSTEGRRATLRDTPVLVAVRRSAEEIGILLGA